MFNLCRFDWKMVLSCQRSLTSQKSLFKSLSEESNIKKTLFLEEQFDSQSQLQSQSQSQQSTDSSNVQRRSNMRFEYPKLKDYNELPHNPQLRQLIDLESVVVITGFGETSPWGQGNSRTRWEMEAYGEFSLEGCIEMAWIMGLIEYKDRVRLNNGKIYAGWVDAATGDPVNELEVKQKYEQKILEHSGIRYFAILDFRTINI